MAAFKFLPGELTPEEAKALTVLLRDVDKLKKLLPISDFAKPTFEKFQAKITARASGGQYSWTEQWYDDTGAYEDKVNGRVGTDVDMPLYERNGSVTASFPFYAEITACVLVFGALNSIVYEFDLPGNSASSLTVKQDTGSPTCTGISTLEFSAPALTVTCVSDGVAGVTFTPECADITTPLNTCSTVTQSVVTNICPDIREVVFVSTAGVVTDVTVAGMSILDTPTNFMFGETKETRAITMVSAITTIDDPICTDTADDLCCQFSFTCEFGIHTSHCTIWPNKWKATITGFVNDNCSNCGDLNAVFILPFAPGIDACDWIGTMMGNGCSIIGSPNISLIFDGSGNWTVQFQVGGQVFNSDPIADASFNCLATNNFTGTYTPSGSPHACLSGTTISIVVEPYYG